MKKAIALILALFMCLTILAGCNSETPPSTSDSETPPVTNSDKGNQQIEQGGGLDVDAGVDITEETKYYEELTIIQDNTKTTIIDPQNTAASSSSSFVVFNIVYDRLIQRKIDGNEPGLALSWESTDLQHYTFKLRPDVLFHNGEKFTTNDIAFTIDRAIEVGVGTMAYSKWNAVESYEIIDEYTIKMNLNDVNVDFLTDLAEPYMGILNKKACEADSENGTWVGTGPYMVDTFVSNEYGVYVANVNYWATPPITKKLTIQFVAEETARLIALKNNEADIVFSINPVHFNELAEDPNFMTFAYTVNNPVMVTFNTTDPLMADINFRKACMSALYRPDIITAARDGYGEEPTAGMFWGYGTEYKNEDIPLVPYDLDAAKQYLAESSYNGETIEIATAIVDISAGAQIVQQQLEKIGISTSIYQTDPPGMVAHTTWGSNKSQIVVFVGGWTNSASSCRSWFYPGNNVNRAALDDPEINDLLDEALKITDDKERETAYKKVQELVAEKYVYYLIYWTKHVVASQPGVGGLVLHSDAYHDYTNIYRIIED